MSKEVLVIDRTEFDPEIARSAFAELGVHTPILKICGFGFHESLNNNPLSTQVEDAHDDLNKVGWSLKRAAADKAHRAFSKRIIEEISGAHMISLVRYPNGMGYFISDRSERGYVEREVKKPMDYQNNVGGDYDDGPILDSLLTNDYGTVYAMLTFTRGEGVFRAARSKIVKGNYIAKTTDHTHGEFHTGDRLLYPVQSSFKKNKAGIFSPPNPSATRIDVMTKTPVRENCITYYGFANEWA